MMHCSTINISDGCPTLMKAGQDHSFGQGERSLAEQRIRIAAVITIVVMVGEIFMGWVTGSMALLADGIHMGGHTVALGLAVGAYIFSRRYAQDRRLSLGSGKINDLAAYTSALFLGASVVWLVIESIQRLLHPKTLYPLEALSVALIGLVVNMLCAWLLAGKHGFVDNHAQEPHGACKDNNLRAALVHVIADAITSMAAIFGLLAAWLWGWNRIDPFIALAASVVVLRWTLTLLRQTGAVLLDAEGPDHIRDKVRQRLESVHGSRVAGMHLWSVGQGEWTLMASVVSHGPVSPESFKARLADLPNIHHPIIEIHYCTECVQYMHT